MCNNNKNSVLSDKLIVFINECLEKENPESYLISVLHKVQNEVGFLGNEQMEEVAYRLGVPTSTVYGVATFYHYFRLKPRGKHAISVCMGTACFVKGADQVLDEFKKELGIDMGETTSDGLFSIESTRCIGVCALAPVVTINDKVFSNVKSHDVHTILNTIKIKNREEAEAHETI